jgi:hypothetical protein
MCGVLSFPFQSNDACLYTGKFMGNLLEITIRHRLSGVVRSRRFSSLLA